MCLECYGSRPEPATPPAVTYDWEKTDPPVIEWSEPITLDEPIAKALLRHDHAREQHRPQRSERIQKVTTDLSSPTSTPRVGLAGT